MDMSVDEKARRVFVDEPPEGPKSSVAPVFLVMNVPWRCMGDYHIDAPLCPDPRPEFPDHHSHLAFSILMGTAIIPVRTFQAQDIDLPEPNQPRMNIGTVSWRFGLMTDIMVSMHVVEGNLEYIRKKGEILGGQVPAGDDQFHPCEPTWLKAVGEERLRII